MQDFGRYDGTFRLADGTAECMRAVREQLRRGAAVIKVCASGGVLSEVDHPVHQQFTDAELRAIVEVAGLADRVVAAHCHGKPGIMAALRAGVATIEHGTYLDEEACDAMRETGTILVPTRTIIENILAGSADARLKARGDRRLEADHSADSGIRPRRPRGSRAAHPPDQAGKPRYRSRLSPYPR